MKTTFPIFLFILLAIYGCNKDKTVTSGTITIDNELFGTGPYYGYGFHVPTGEKVSTLNSPIDVITLFVDFEVDYSVRKIYLSVNNFTDSFYKYGQYPSESEVSDSFKNLKSFNTSQWYELADSIKPHQIWLFRTSEEKYTKIRIIKTFTEKRAGMTFPFAECTFEWVFQPDGTQSFQ